MDASALSRFLTKVSVGTGDGACWEWAAYRNSDGYGTFKALGKMRKAHRVSYEHFVGPIPEGLQLDHLCRNPACVRPDHLEPVTNRENTRRGITGLVNGGRQRAKTHCPAGHEYGGVNLGVRPNGSRRCRACHRDQMRQRYWVERMEV